MYRADKFYGPDRQVLANISLSFLPGREDRRARAERRGQVDPAADHGGARRAVERRRRAGAGSDRRAARAGAGARSRQGRARQRRGRRARGCATCSTASTPSPPRSPSRTPTSTRCSPSRRRCRTRSTAATSGTSTPRSTTRWTRCASPRATATSRACRAESAGASPSAGCCSRRPTCCSSTSRRTTSTPSRSGGSSASCTSYKGTVVAVTHDRYFLDNVAGWILELDRGRGLPFKGNYSSWLEQKQARLAAEEKQESARRRTLARELEWVRMSPKARHAKSKARLGAYEKLLRRGAGEAAGCASRSTFRPVRALATQSSRQITWRRASATACSSRT